ncbi:unnamed protein product [Brachionus calyciflorus]|uniref:Ion transport domain-containing protein n=1 Tax=Brachionus calyciflorus TaxID=104777 RepID=A0A814EX98_9BILA|nr:unnamed protein product [Brachionus calyciflorus]
MSGLLEQTSGLRDLIDVNTNSQYEAAEFRDNTKSDSILRATVLIEDAINFRSIFHKVGRYPLIVYRSYYSSYIQRFLYLNIFVILILAFFESPSSLSYSSDITKPKDYLTKYEFPCGILESVDIFCLFLFFLDASIKSYLIGRKQVIKSPWLIAYFFVLVISFVDCIVSLSTKCEETVRIRRYLRPFFLIQCSSLMKKTIKSLKRTLPQIISVFVLLLIHLYLFAIIGMLIFPRYYIENINTNTNDTFPVINKEYLKNKAFSTISVSLNNLLILITTSNNPDITIQSYAENRFAALYYVTFLIIGLYSLMSLFIAVIYNQFKGFFQDSMMSSAFRQSLGIRAAFWVLHDKFHVERNPGAIPKNALACVIKAISLNKKRKDHLLKALDDLDTGINDIPETDLTIELEQFEKLFFDNLNDEISNTDLDEFFDSNSYERRNTDFSARIAEFRKKLKRIYLSKAYLVIASIITIINIGCITVSFDLLLFYLTLSSI